MDKFANLQAFVTVVEAGSFSHAAERLAVAKSVVSRRLTLLEQELGVQLLRRTTRNLSLTSAGRLFYERAVRILGDLEEAEQSLADASAALRGKLRIAAPLSFGLHRLNDILSDFMQAHPAIELDLDLNDREVNLVEEGFDMAVRVGDLRDSTLVARRIGTARFVTCASPAYLASHGTPGHPSELESHIGLQYSNVSPSQAWNYQTGDNGSELSLPGIRMRANNGDVLAHAAVAGLGIVVSPTFIASELIASGRLVTLLDDFELHPIGIYAVFPPGRLVTRRVQALADFLHSRLGDCPTWDRAIGIVD